MTLFVVKYTLLCALIGGTSCACMLKNHTLWIERHDFAQCVAINTTICSGYCYTQDTNLKGRFGRTFLIQRSCVPLSLIYHTAPFPGCSEDVTPQLYYPAARRCTCGRCDTRSHHCVRTRRVYYDQCPVTLGNKTQGNGSCC
ncbi:follitropin subunit beta-like [Solea senegalensis]|uniref:Gonadotropin subunit beta-2 n=2 Tax=Solea senegalensis TaxID=28829 RepID=A0AAV6SS91_SOLSE|nr:follitropin subunit beta-like [Solea senegalensis]